MVNKSKIEWTDVTWNPVTGCTKISLGCAHCYAEHMARRLAGRYGYQEPPHHFDVTLHPDRLEEPLKWRKPRMCFVVSMGDLFHDDVPDKYIKRVWNTMIEAGHKSDSIFQVLTKRPKRMREFVNDFFNKYKYTPRNIWLGVTAESQTTFYPRYYHLSETHAIVRFVSMEPLLGSIDMEDATPDWVIVGGESGHGARPMHPDWVRSIRDQCTEKGVPFFFKQWGDYGANHTVWHEAGYNPSTKKGGRMIDGHEWNEYPQ